MQKLWNKLLLENFRRITAVWHFTLIWERTSKANQVFYLFVTKFVLQKVDKLWKLRVTAFLPEDCRKDKANLHTYIQTKGKNSILYLSRNECRKSFLEMITLYTNSTHWASCDNFLQKKSNNSWQEHIWFFSRSPSLWEESRWHNSFLHRSPQYNRRYLYCVVLLHSMAAGFIQFNPLAEK